MDISNKLFLLFICLLIKINCDKKVINTCGNNIGYKEPQNHDDCKQDGELCCFVSVKDKDNVITNFCVSSPSDIEKEDVESKIKDYTGFTLVDLKCNRCQYIYNSIIILLFYFIFLI